jgi:hypothetical protein
MWGKLFITLFFICPVHANEWVVESKTENLRYTQIMTPTILWVSKCFWNKIEEFPKVPSGIDLFWELRKVPNISLPDYLAHLQENLSIEFPTFILGVIYLDRFLIKTNAELTLYNIHQLFLVSLLTAVKMNEDHTYGHSVNKYFSMYGAVSLKRLNYLEKEFVKELGFNLEVSPESFLLVVKQVMYNITDNMNFVLPASEITVHYVYSRDEPVPHLRH